MQILSMVLVTLDWRCAGSWGSRWCHTLPRGSGAAELRPKPSTARRRPLAVGPAE